MDTKSLLLEAAKRDSRFKSQLNALDSAMNPPGPDRSELGCEVELGAFGGVADIPSGLWAQQQWAGRAPDLVAVAGANLIRVNLPLRYARDWTIQLAAPSVPSGAPFGQPSTFNGQVRIDWGHHGAQESITCDWPQLGGSITIHGSYLAVSVSDTVLPRSATYAAWLSEGSAARAGLPAFQPVFTQFISSLAVSATSAIFPVVNRARAYSVNAVPVAPPTVPNDLVLTWADNLATARARHHLSPDNAFLPTGLFEWAKPRPIPVHAGSWFIQNLDAVNTWSAITMTQWLDVGS